MTLLDEQYGFRAGLVERLERDLVGPGGGEEETIGDAPITTYASGILYPPSADTPRPESDIDDQGLEASDAGDSAPDDPAVNLANVRYPSSMGLTFSVHRDAVTLVAEIRAARYEPIDGNEDLPAGQGPAPVENGDPADSGQSNGDGTGSRSQWRRRPFSTTVDTIDATTPGEGRLPVADGLELFYRVRPPDGDDVAVTLILINTLRAERPWKRDTSSWFQSSITVTTPDDADPMFVSREGPEPPDWDSDLRSQRLLYRHAASMGVGHGCSVVWDLDSDVPGRCRHLETTFVPSFALPLSVSNPDIPTRSLRFVGFARGDRAVAIDALNELCDRYSVWIDETRAAAAELRSELSEIADEHLVACEDALERMRRGVSLLSTDELCWTAFRVANEAMLLQRARGVWLAAGASPIEQPDLRAAHGWRPFQIAFILLCLEGVADESSADRGTADLLWFPTGGGKTEAYLGLLAFTVALRRLRNPESGHGVTALMRYTLRLLTIQQFERATLLICCLESIRRNRSDLGTETISIGLWVGRAATPNDLEEARRALDKLRRGATLEEGNPLQLSRCPWCGTELDSRSVYITKKSPRLVIACRTDDCDFKRGLPVSVVDQDIYNQHPTLVIATADKFASLPWTEHGRGLFNLDLPGVPPPSLIIQDELHLISGPLGTLAGLYETAIDMLCSHRGRVPKVVASTATIRRASEQTMALFGRDVRQFPAPGLDAGDSFFAVESPPERSGNRLYVGCMAPGTSHTTLMVRAYAAILQGASELPGSSEVRDPYWTLVGYFNSLRVLGGARMQVQDDVNDRIELLANRSGSSGRETEGRIEMTSRESSGDIPDHLQRMSIVLPDADALDVILATNMISVGVDIDRLGLMAVMGQPQSTSEYIQATSRVGRRHPGLVIDLLNASKSRDRSHFESFVDFHSALYRQVESSSVTPFSSRARTRGLHAILIALARLTIPDLRENGSARDVGKVEQQVRAIIPKLLERVRIVDPQEADNTERQLDEIVDDWLSRATDEPSLVFRNQRDPQVSLLGDAALTESELLGAIPTLWSLRDVDQSSNLYLV